jgi:hypothetical protein
VPTRLGSWPIPRRRSLSVSPGRIANCASLGVQTPAQTSGKIVWCAHRAAVLTCIEKHRPSFMLNDVDVGGTRWPPGSRRQQPPQERSTGRLHVLWPDPYCPGPHHGHFAYRPRSLVNRWELRAALRARTDALALLHVLHRPNPSNIDPLVWRRSRDLSGLGAVSRSTSRRLDRVGCAADGDPPGRRPLRRLAYVAGTSDQRGRAAEGRDWWQFPVR